MSANTEQMMMGNDPLNIIKDEVKPLPPHVLARLEKGRTKRTQILDGSKLEQHAHLRPYAFTRVKMTFNNEDDIIRCARLLQWSDERMRARRTPRIMWDWQKSFREGMTVEFSVGWYSKKFFEENREAFKDSSHASYFAKFGLTTADIKTTDEIIGSLAVQKRPSKKAGRKKRKGS